jgi:DNA polymerase III sliding clamp (beta) subunit (PCNA family)
MNRTELVKTLELVQPALSTNNLVPVFSCFMFGKSTISAYNDSLGIVAKGSVGTEPFATPGVTLLGLLQNSHAEEVDFELTKEYVIAKTGKSVFKLPYETKFLFTQPKESWDATIEINPDVLKGVEICLTTSSKDQAQPAIMGVCFNFDSTKLFSCDGDAITRYSPTVNMLGKGSYTIPNAFCDALLKITAETGVTEGELEVSRDWAAAHLNNGFHLYGRMIVNDKPLDHQKLIDSTLQGKQPFVPLPLGLNEALARARVLADIETKVTNMTIKDGVIQLWTSTHMGDIKDTVKIKGHPDVEALVHASLVARSIAVCDQISIRENATAYKLDNTVLQVVSNIGE